MKLFAVYKIHNIETEMDYIGWSINPVNRVFKQHEKMESYIGNAIRLYGWDAFDVDVLHLVRTKKEACRLEIKEIKDYNCVAPNGYNLTRGGEGTSGFKWPKDSRIGKDNPNYGNGAKIAGDKNPMKQPEVAAKCGRAGRGVKKPGSAKKGKENPSHRVDVRYKRLKTRLQKLLLEV